VASSGYPSASRSGSYGRYAGTVAERLQDCQQALDDPKIKAILCSRGGYGCIHLLDQLDLTAFNLHPKWLIGYSDITLLHTQLQRNGFASIHGGMAKQLNVDNEARTSLQALLFGQLPIYQLDPHPLNRFGQRSGILFGGNLTLLMSLRGTPYEYIPSGGILFIEDTGEKPYVIDRYLHALQLGGILDRINGLIIGHFTDYEEDPLMLASVYELIAQVTSRYTFPVCFQFPVGHMDDNRPLITGSLVQLTVDEYGSRLSFSIENSVS
jgi:muramoyltetrapeptide carboxypeptidase